MCIRDRIWSCVTSGSHSFTCHPHTHTNHTCLYSPAARLWVCSNFEQVITRFTITERVTEERQFGRSIAQSSGPSSRSVGQPDDLRTPRYTIHRCQRLTRPVCLSRKTPRRRRCLADGRAQLYSLAGSYRRWSDFTLLRIRPDLIAYRPERRSSTGRMSRSCGGLGRADEVQAWRGRTVAALSTE